MAVMKKNIVVIKKSCLFLLGLFSILYILGLPFQGLEKYGYRYMLVYPKLLSFQDEQKNSMDYLFVGDSLSWAGYNPVLYEKDTGYKGFNLSTSGQAPVDSYFFVKNALKTQKPKVLVLETHGFFNNNYFVKDTFLSIFPIFNYHAMYRFDLKAEGKSNLGFNWTEAKQAYVGGNSYSHSLKRKILGDHLSTEFLTKIKDLCDKHGIRLILCSTPTKINWCQEEHDLVKKWTSENKITYYDFNLIDQQIGLDWNKDTRDAGDHLNSFGEEKLRRYFAPILKQEIEKGETK